MEKSSKRVRKCNDKKAKAKSSAKRVRASVAIVGGGISGLVCGNRLQQLGFDKVVCFDTGQRACGGRCSSRVIRGDNDDCMCEYICDHAAQYFTVTDKRFERLVKHWLRHGVCRRWDTAFACVRPGKDCATPVFVETPVCAYIGNRGMQSLPLSLGSEINTQRPIWISKLEQTKESKWKLFNNDKEVGTFDYVVIAHNGKCADRLMASAGVPRVHRLLRVNFGPSVCGRTQAKMQLNSLWVLMFILPANQRTGARFNAFYVKLPSVPELSWCSNNSAKYRQQNDKNQGECWTLISSGAYGKANKVPQENIPPEKAKKVTKDMLKAFERIIGLSEPLKPYFTRVQLWGAAVPLNGLAAKHGREFAFEARSKVGVCGDWLCAKDGASIESAAISGMALAEHIVLHASAKTPDTELDIGLGPKSQRSIKLFQAVPSSTDIGSIRPGHKLETKVKKKKKKSLNDSCSFLLSNTSPSIEEMPQKPLTPGKQASFLFGKGSTSNEKVKCSDRSEESGTVETKPEIKHRKFTNTSYVKMVVEDKSVQEVKGRAGKSLCKCGRKQRAQIAKETLQILQNGVYEVCGHRVDIRNKLAAAVRNTVFFPPTHEFSFSSKGVTSPRICVRSIGVLAAVTELQNSLPSGANICALNFASAKKPGGGFIKGSLAQEECLAYATGIHSCLTGPTGQRFYAGRKSMGVFYTDRILYSPGVPVFRPDDSTALNREPCYVSVITCAAVNQNLALREHTCAEVNGVMSTRVLKILQVAASQGVDAIVLGAFGCGVFKNDPYDVANIFRVALQSISFPMGVVFAIPDGQGQAGSNLRAFQAVFGARMSKVEGRNKPDVSKNAMKDVIIKVPKSRKENPRQNLLSETALNRFAVKENGVVAPLIDIGANLTKLKPQQLESQLRRANAAGVRHVIITGTSLRATIAAEKICNRSNACKNPQKSSKVAFTAGVHPHHAKEWDSNTLSVLEKTLSNPCCVAVGEAGLDYDRMLSPRAKQLAVFLAQVQLAVRQGYSLFVHERDRGKGRILGSHEDLCHILEESGIEPSRVCIHCFTGTEEHLQDYLRRGYTIGLTGFIGKFRRGAVLRDTLTKIAASDEGCELLLSRLMIETDAPYMRPDLDPSIASSIQLARRGNEPCVLPAVARELAKCLGVSAATVARRTTNNSKSFFKL